MISCSCLHSKRNAKVQLATKTLNKTVIKCIQKQSQLLLA